MHKIRMLRIRSIPKASLVAVTPHMRIAQEEVFRPVIVIIKFTHEQETIALANSTEYALGSSVSTLEYERDERVANQLRAGMCNVDFGANYLCGVNKYFS